MFTSKPLAECKLLYQGLQYKHNIFEIKAYLRNGSL